MIERCKICGELFTNPGHEYCSAVHGTGKKHIIDYSLHYRVNGFNIEMELQSKFNEATNSLSKWVVNTKDEAIRRALIALGWTPPKD